MPLDPTQTVITTLFVYKDKLYVGLADYRVSVIDLKSFEIIGEITEDLWEVKRVFVDSNNIYVGSLNEQLLIYNHNFDLVEKIKHELGVISIDVDTKYIYTGSYDGRVLIWNKDDFHSVNSLSNHLIRVNDIITDDNYIYTGDGFTTIGAQIRKWNKINLNLISEFLLPSAKRVNCMVMDSSYIYAGYGSPAEIRIIDLSTQKLVTKIETKYDVKSISVNLKFMLVTLKDKIQIYDLSTFELLKEISEDGREVNDCKFYGPNIIYSSRDQVRMIDSRNFTLLNSLKYQANTN